MPDKASVPKSVPLRVALLLFSLVEWDYLLSLFTERGGEFSWIYQNAKDSQALLSNAEEKRLYWIGNYQCLLCAGIMLPSQSLFGA